MFQAAEDALAADAGAKVLLHRIVKHFQRLFDVSTLAGMFPKMNELYLFVNEAHNFMTVLKQMLGLDLRVSTNACLAALRRALEDDSRIREARAAPATSTAFDHTVLGQAPAAPASVPLRTAPRGPAAPVYGAGAGAAPARAHQQGDGLVGASTLYRQAPFSLSRGGGGDGPRDVWGVAPSAEGDESTQRGGGRGGDAGQAGPEYVRIGATSGAPGRGPTRQGLPPGAATAVAAAAVTQRSGGIGWTVV